MVRAGFLDLMSLRQFQMDEHDDVIIFILGILRKGETDETNPL